MGDIFVSFDSDLFVLKERCVLVVDVVKHGTYTDNEIANIHNYL